jgi:plastocyanin
VGISRRAGLIGLLIGANLLAGAAAVGAPSAGRAAPVTVQMQASDFRFCAAAAAACTPLDTGSVTVPVGSTVVWTYTDHACDAVVPCPGHNVQVTGGQKGQTLKREGAVLLSETFDRPGTYAYICSIHAQFGMTGTVIVQGDAAAPSSGGGPASTKPARPARTHGTPPTAHPATQLAFTGVDAVLPALAVLCLCGAAVLARRSRSSPAS